MNPVQGESDLAPLTDGDLDRVFGRRSADKVTFAELAARFGHRRELLPIVMIFVFLFLAVEALLGAWQSVRKNPGLRKPLIKPPLPLILLTGYIA